MTARTLLNILCIIRLEVLFIKCIRIMTYLSYPGPYFPAFGLDTEKYEVISAVSLNAEKHGPE